MQRSRVNEIRKTDDMADGRKLLHRDSARLVFRVINVQTIGMFDTLCGAVNRLERQVKNAVLLIALRGNDHRIGDDDRMNTYRKL